MPRPPALPTLDWRAIFESGLPYGAWIDTGEAPDHRKQMEEARSEQHLSAMVVAWLHALPRDVYVVAIAEDWCGDVVRHVPVLAALDDAAPRLHVRYITREQHPQVFTRFLTNGGEAIPKFVFLSDQYVESGHWGPMPEDCRRLIARGKACGDVSTARKRVSARYEADPEKREVVEELLALIDIASTERV